MKTSSSKLLVEILCEELPALPLLKESANFSAKWQNALSKQNLEAPAQIYFTPRRICIYAPAFPAHTKEVVNELFGPPKDIAFIDGEPSKGLSKAGEGFIKKANIAPNQIQFAQKDGKEVLYARSVKPGVPSSEVVALAVEDFLLSLQFGKSMRWGGANVDSGAESSAESSDKSGAKNSAQATQNTQATQTMQTTHFIRPIRNILILLESSAESKADSGASNAKSDSSAQGTSAKSSTLHITTSAYSQPSHQATILHRDLIDLDSDSSFEKSWTHIASIEDYFKALESGGVELDFAKRKEKILSQIKQIEQKERIKVELDSALLDEVGAITEYPRALLGRFDERFLRLPSEVIITSMKENQRYFAIFKDGALYNGFIVVSNSMSKDLSLIIGGNERVLKARLSDAEFFYDNDKKSPLNPSPLAQVAFVDGLGSMLDKTKREQDIGAYLCEKYGLDSSAREVVKEALWISKAYLLSEMVGEFPELQGVMGYYYALSEGKSQELALGIKEQYLPNGEASALPSTKISAIVAMSGKLDSLLALFSVGKIPSGSKDPFALRRAANGVLKIALEFGLALDLQKDLVALAKGYKAFDVEGLRWFMLERLEAILRLSALTFRSVSRGLSSEVLQIASNAYALESLQEREDKDALISIFKRVANITKDFAVESGKAESAGKADSGAESKNVDSAIKIDESLLKLPQEKALWEAFVKVKSGDKTIEPKVLLEGLFGLKGALEAFFDNVLVNDENPALRHNRKAIIYAIYAEFKKIGDLKELAA